jgi:thiol-disulfide isomerase/thioredoxin
MRHTLLVSILLLGMLVLPSSARGQETVGEALARLQTSVDAFGKDPADPELQEETYALLGQMLEQHLEALPDRHLTWIASLWFQLASDRGDHAAADARAAALRARHDLPPRLEQAIARCEARLKVRPGHVLTAWNAVDVASDRYAPVFAPGRLTLVQFWASWCPPCRRLMRERLRPLLAELGSEFELVSVGVPGKRETAESQAEFARRQGYRWTFLHDEGGDCAEAFGVSAHPYLFLVDEERRVLVCGPGWQVIDAVRELLEERRASREGVADEATE